MRGLVLSGGGARGAYQAGAISGIIEIAQELKINNPFQVYSGVSAGSINATYMAANCHKINAAAMGLCKIWNELVFDSVFETNALSLGKIGISWVRDFSVGNYLGSKQAQSLLNTAPLRTFLKEHVLFSDIQDRINEGLLHALAITATNYKTSSAITFVQGVIDHVQWNKTRRSSHSSDIKVDHIMASSAIPLLFPSIALENSFYGDGCVRNLSPCGPSIYLGCRKLIVIGVRKQTLTLDDEIALYSKKPPSIARIINSILNAILLDGVDVDIDRLSRLNKLVSKLSQEEKQKNQIKEVDYLFLTPSEDIGAIAARMAHRLPRVIRYVLKSLGPLEDASEIISYLLFDPDFTSRLTEMGYKDAINQKEQIKEFFLR